ncbi:NAD(P)/FAD-dependent oxidoreductase [Dyadobacter sp. 3J3]|uniref:NAD(P)/FAD-dependent oxidoreductase n=1 Tax=Dyadobacter sp. 3J3 TaxID=2606600 RepID=UPI00135A0DBE|nr:NAD(P)/FAD-dependent oxidoreductase [Dyadobacter sp. 3J3]
MKIKSFDVIIIGGSYSGLAAGLALGRALKHVLIIDSGDPCNKQTPYSHNFLTNDGKKPTEIIIIGKRELQMYNTVTLLNGLATKGIKTEYGFEICLESGETFNAKKLIFATGIKDTMADIDGFSACWGISVLHCPYCHGYEVRNEKTGILSNGQAAFDLSGLISNWTNNLTLFTNGPAMLTVGQLQQLDKRQINIVEKQIQNLVHIDGNLQHIIFKDGTKYSLKAIYSPAPFTQHCQIPESLGCKLTDEGYLEIDSFQHTTIEGVFACGDNSMRTRTVSNAVAMGTATGIIVSKKMILDEFNL